MPELSLETVGKLKNNRKMDQELLRRYDERKGNAAEFRNRIDQFKKNNGLAPECWRRR